MKRLIVLFAIAFSVTTLGFGLFTFLPANAQTDPFEVSCQSALDNGTPWDQLPESCKHDNPQDPISGADQEGILIKVTRLIAILTGVAAVIAVIVGGIEYIMSSGDPAKINTAKNTILFAFIGLIVATSAALIIRFVLSKL